MDIGRKIFVKGKKREVSCDEKKDFMDFLCTIPVREFDVNNASLASKGHLDFQDRVTGTTRVGGGFTHPQYSSRPMFV